MKKPAALAARLNRAAAGGKIEHHIGMNEISGGKHCTAAYIAELSGELRALAGRAGIAPLEQLLARAQLEAELWSR